MTLPLHHDAARAGILDRLVSALVRERLVAPEDLGLPLRAVNAAGKLVVVGPGPDPAALLDALPEIRIRRPAGANPARSGSSPTRSVASLAAGEVTSPTMRRYARW